MVAGSQYGRQANALKRWHQFSKERYSTTLITTEQLDAAKPPGILFAWPPKAQDTEGTETLDPQ